MSELHSLLRRQLRKRGVALAELSSQVQQFLEDDVHRAYADFDADRQLLERSLDLSSEELLQANAEFRAMLHALPDLVLWLSKEGMIQRVAPQDPSDLASVDEGGLIGHRLWDVPQEVAAATLRSAFAKSSGDDTTTCEYPLVVGGQRRFYEARIARLYDGTALAVIRNITARRTAWSLLESERDILQFTMDSVAESIVTSDRHGRILFANRAATTLAGSGPLQGRVVDEVFRCTTQEGRPVMLADLHGATQLVCNARGSHEPVLVQASGRNLGSDRSWEKVLVLRDITADRKREEERIRASRLESTALLASSIAHDFNNLLASILGNVSVLAGDTSLHRDAQAALRDVLLAARQGRSLTERLLGFAKSDPPSVEAVSVRDLLEDATALCAGRSSMSVEVAVDPNVGAVVVDRRQMAQVFNNLVINARQAIGAQGGHLSLAAICREGSDSSHPGFVEVSVTDDGPGISISDLSRVFEPYYTTKESGSGLGLASCRSIVRRHGGDITAESTVGSGATFRVLLPATKAPPRSSTPAPPQRRFEGRRIMVYDDDPVVRRALERLLRHLGVAVTAVSTFDQALHCWDSAKSRGHSFHAALLDLTVPGGHGGEAFVRALGKLDTAPAIAMSGRHDDQVMSHPTQHGFAASLRKPFTIADVADVLEEAFNS